MQPPTVIFHLSARFKADAFPKKLNLGVGAYRDEALKPVVFSAVRKAEQLIVNAGYDKEYLPIAGLPEFRVRMLSIKSVWDHVVADDVLLLAFQEVG